MCQLLRMGSKMEIQRVFILHFIPSDRNCANDQSVIKEGPKSSLDWYRLNLLETRHFPSGPRRRRWSVSRSPAAVGTNPESSAVFDRPIMNEDGGDLQSFPHESPFPMWDKETPALCVDTWTANGRNWIGSWRTLIFCRMDQNLWLHLVILKGRALFFIFYCFLGRANQSSWLFFFMVFGPNLELALILSTVRNYITRIF